MAVSIVCTACPAQLQTTNKVEERAIATAVKAGWLFGLPHQTVLCPACLSTRYPIPPKP